MEPVFMILGQSAATAASLAIENGIAVQDVDYQQFRERLEELASSDALGGPENEDVQKFLQAWRDRETGKDW